MGSPEKKHYFYTHLKKMKKNIGSILHNVTNLTKAWDGTVKDIPDSLKDWTPTQTEVK